MKKQNNATYDSGDYEEYNTVYTNPDHNNDINYEDSSLNGRNNDDFTIQTSPGHDDDDTATSFHRTPTYDNNNNHHHNHNNDYNYGEQSSVYPNSTAGDTAWDNVEMERSRPPKSPNDADDDEYNDNQYDNQYDKDDDDDEEQMQQQGRPKYTDAYDNRNEDHDDDEDEGNERDGLYRTTPPTSTKKEQRCCSTCYVPSCDFRGPWYVGYFLFLAYFFFCKI
jgi:hypothetical protein